MAYKLSLSSISCNSFMAGCGGGRYITTDAFILSLTDRFDPKLLISGWEAPFGQVSTGRVDGEWGTSKIQSNSNQLEFSSLTSKLVQFIQNQLNKETSRFSFSFL